MSALARRSAAALGLAVLVAACTPDIPTADPGCLAGSRYCDGNRVYLCDPDSGDWEAERICPAGTICIAGYCEDGSAPTPDVSGPPDGAGPGDAAPDPPDAAPDHGVDLPERVDLPVGSDVPHVPDVPHAPDVADAPDVAAVPDGPDVPDVPDVADLPDWPDEGPGPDTADGLEPDEGVGDAPDAGKCGNGLLEIGETCDPSAGAPCIEECPAQVGCAGWQAVGSKAECTADCEPYTVTEAAGGDGCCPAGLASPELDDDCEAVPCGNGKLDTGETCDPSAGAPCLDECPPQVGCNAWKLVGLAAECTADCKPHAVTEPADGDGCCPAGLASDADSDCPPPDCTDPFECKLAYEKVPNILVVDDVRRIAWHPSGEHALLLDAKGGLVRYDAETKALASAATTGGSTTDIAVAKDGSFFAVVGKDKDGKGRVWRYVETEGGALELASQDTISNGDPRAIVRNPAGDDFVVAAAAGSSINYLYRWRSPDGVFASKGYNGPGVRDVMWADPALYAGSAAVVTSDGENGAGSKTWVLATDLVVANGWSPGFGNPGGAGWRPGGSYGILTAWTTNKLYVFDGAWKMATLPGVGTAASPNAIAWNAGGTRALVVGRAIGTPLKAVVTDYRPIGDGFEAASLYDASIEGFGAAPWNGSSNVHLLDVAWRPGPGPAEGLIVGTDTGTSFSPTFGLVIRFFVE